MDKIVLLSKIFSISTDELLAVSKDQNATDITNVKVLLESDINKFLNHISKKSKFYSLATAILIFSPSILIFMLGLMENNLITERLAFAIGISSLFILMITAIMIFISFELNKDLYKQIGVERIYIKDEIQREIVTKDDTFRDRYNLCILVGTLLCFMSILPLLIVLLIESNPHIFLYVTSLALILIALGMYFSVRVLLIKQAYEMLLQKGKYNKVKKKNKKTIYNFTGLVYL